MSDYTIPEVPAGVARRAALSVASAARDEVDCGALLATLGLLPLLVNASSPRPDEVDEGAVNTQRRRATRSQRHGTGGRA